MKKILKNKKLVFVLVAVVLIVAYVVYARSRKEPETPQEPHKETKPAPEPVPTTLEEIIGQSFEIEKPVEAATVKHETVKLNQAK